MTINGGLRAALPLHAHPRTHPQERGHKQVGNGAAFGHFVILMMMLVLGCIWMWQPCTTPWLCRLTDFNFGVTYAFVASTLIVAHMCKEPFEPPMWALAQVRSAQSWHWRACTCMCNLASKHSALRLQLLRQPFPGCLG